jgi:DNA-binding NtrC family response regulator
MNLLFIHHNPEIQSEIEDFLNSKKDSCFFARNTRDAVAILNDHPIDLVILIISHMRDAAVLKYLTDNYTGVEVLLMASEEFDEIITLFADRQFRTVRLPLKLNDLRGKINSIIAEGPDQAGRGNSNE